MRKTERCGGDQQGQVGRENRGRMEKVREQGLARSDNKSERNEKKRSFRAGNRVANSIVPRHFPALSVFPVPLTVQARYLRSLFFTHPRGNSRSQDASRPFEGRKPHQIDPCALADGGGGGERLQFFARCTCGFRTDPLPARSRKPVRQPIGRDG